MKIDINEDFEKTFKQTVWKSFTKEEVLSAVLGLIVLFGVAIGLWKVTGLPVNITIYFGIPGMLLVALPFNIKCQGQTAFTYLKNMYYRLKTKTLIFEASERTQADKRIFRMRSKHQKRKKGRGNK